MSQHPGPGGSRERDIVYPLVHQRRGTDGQGRGETGWGLRPLFFTRRSDDGYRRETTYLWPLGRYSAKPGQLEFRLTPLFSYRARYNDKGTIDRDYIVLLFFFGSDDKEGDYFGLLPFGGTTRGLLAREKMEYFLFPLYLKTYDYGYEGTNILFPFFAYGHGKGREVLTVFPFYLRQAKQGRYDRRAYLWPLVHVQENALGSADPIDTFMVWPFYGQDISRSGEKVSRTILWPFFGWRIHRDGDEYSYVEYSMPWPFFRYVRSERVDVDRYWPIYWRQHEKARKSLRTSVLWPIGWHETVDRERFDKENLWILPFFWDFRTAFKEGGELTGETERYTKLWPLFHRHRTRDGAVEHQLLSLWWFRDAEPYGFRDNYDPLFTLYYMRDDPARSEHLFSILGPTLRWHRRKDGADFRFLVFRWNRRGQGEVARRGWSLLEGLVGYSDDAGRQTLRLLWLPIRWGQSRLPGGQPR